MLSASALASGTWSSLTWATATPARQRLASADNMVVSHYIADQSFRIQRRLGEQVLTEGPERAGGTVGATPQCCLLPFLAAGGSAGLIRLN